jgi:hypothetical protein
MTPGRPRRPRRAAPVVAVALALGLSIAVAAVALASSQRVPPLRALSGAIRVQDRTVESGGTIRGEVVFVNRTSTPRVLMRGCLVDGLYGIGLRASDGYVQAPAFSLVGCHPEQEMVAKPGTTVYRFTVPATYVQCSQSARDQPPRSSKYWIPLCLKDSSGHRDRMPPLPPGRYSALFFPATTWHGPHVEPATVLVTIASYP